MHILFPSASVIATCRHVYSVADRRSSVWKHRTICRSFSSRTTQGQAQLVINKTSRCILALFFVGVQDLLWPMPWYFIPIFHMCCNQFFYNPQFYWSHFEYSVFPPYLYFVRKPYKRIAIFAFKTTFNRRLNCMFKFQRVSLLILEARTLSTGNFYYLFWLRNKRKY